MKVALYIRVSTREQVENYSIASQEEKLRAFCKSKDWAVYDTYIDGGYSGADTERPDLQRMLSDIDNIDAVVVYKLDRLSRSQRDTLDLIEEKFLKNNTEFVSITETLDTSTPFGKAMIGILSVFAQLERETITERMRNGQIKRAEEGYRVAGGDYDPAGYERKNGDLITKQHEKEHIQTAFNLYEQYHSVTKVQRELKLKGYPVWRFRRYRDILSNKLYTGYVSFAGTYYKGRHEPFVSQEQFDRVQILLDQHKGSNANSASRSLLSGLVTCGCCGEKYVSYTSKDIRKGKAYEYRYYICRARRFPAEYPEKCMNKNWNGKKLEKLIINELQYLTVGKQMEQTKQDGPDYATNIKQIDQKIERVLSLYTDGLIEKEKLDKQIGNLNRDKEAILQKQKEQEINQRNKLTDEDIKEYVINLKNADFKTKQATIQKLIRNMTVNGDDIAIEWRV